MKVKATKKGHNDENTSTETVLFSWFGFGEQTILLSGLNKTLRTLALIWGKNDALEL